MHEGIGALAASEEGQEGEEYLYHGLHPVEDAEVIEGMLLEDPHGPWTDELAALQRALVRASLGKEADRFV